MSRALGFAVALSALACGACRAPEARSWRWIDAPPTSAIAAADLREVECAQRFEFPDGTLPAGLELVEGTRVDSPGGGLTVRGGLVAPRLSWRPDAGAAAARMAKVVVSGLRRGQLRLRWFGADGEPGGEVELHKSAGTGALRDHFLLDFGADAPAIARLELEPTTAAGELVTLSEICLGRPAGIEHRLEAAAAAPWKVTLGGETRDALLVPPDGRVSRQGDPGGAARFDFGLGRLAGGAGALRVTVERGRPGAEPRPELERRIEPAELAAGWIDLAVELGAAPRGEVELAVRVEAEAPTPDLVLALSSPRVRTLGAPDPRPHVVLVSIDTLRADHLSLYGYPRPTSPHLDAWAREHATVFRRVVAPSGWTLPSHFSLFTGLDGPAHPANHDSIAIDPGAYRFLAGQLVAAGYRTRAVTGGAYVSPDYGLATGFERFRAWSRMDRRNDELDEGIREAGRVLDEMAAAEDPYFFFFHTYEVHTPNGPRPPFTERFHGSAQQRVVDLGTPPRPRPEDGFLGGGRYVLRDPVRGDEQEVGPDQRALVVDAYDAAVAFVDDRLGPLLDRLSRPPFAGRTVVAIVSDHGESLGEGGRAGHNFLSADNLLVPLLLEVPGRRGGGRTVESQVRLHDLYPTLLELAGARVPDGIDARSLGPLLADEREPGRTALSYVATTNRGMSLITPGGLQLIWRNSPWRALAGRFLWSRIEGFSAREAAPPAAPGEAERLEAAIQAAYARRAPGLRLEIRNLDARPAAVSLVTELIDPISIKSASADSAPVDWLDVGRLRAELPPGEHLSLHFERIPRRLLSLTLGARVAACAQEERLAIHGTISELRTPRQARIEPGGCPASPGPGRVEAEVFWQGPAPSSALAPGDEERAEDLRALGYLR